MGQVCTASLLISRYGWKREIIVASCLVSLRELWENVNDEGQECKLWRTHGPATVQRV